MEDDIAIISNTTAHGLPQLADEAGDSEASATALCTSIGSCIPSPTTAGYVHATVVAVLNSENDRDFFSFTASAGGSATIRIDYTPLWIQQGVHDTGSQGTLMYASSFQRSNLRLDLGFAVGTPVQGLVKPSPKMFDASHTFTATLPAAGEAHTCKCSIMQPPIYRIKDAGCVHLLAPDFIAWRVLVAQISCCLLCCNRSRCIGAMAAAHNSQPSGGRFTLLQYP
jgi:hypothetical protein